MSSINLIQAQISERIKAKAFDDFGYAKLKTPLSMGAYRNWLKENLNGDMLYLQKHTQAKENPSELLTNAQSAIVVARNYFPHPKPHQTGLEKSRVALYAQGEDYHRWFLKELHDLATELKGLYPHEDFLPMTDSKPVLERDLAYRAGLGWVGKNTCLIDSKRGSLFFIGEIYTSFPLQQEAPLHPDRCGTCTRCIDVCPTDAIIEPKKLDARKCISYLTIESKETPSDPLKSGMGDWLFGCDLCQTVCPWNEKAFGPVMKELSSPRKNTSERELGIELQEILEASNKNLKRRFQATALDRAGPNGLKRNAILVIGNLRLSFLEPSLRGYLNHPKLGELAQWALERIRSRPSSPKID